VVDRQYDSSVKLTKDREVLALCDEIERMILESRAGVRPRMKGCDPLRWELMLRWHRRERQHEQMHLGIVRAAMLNHEER
jgi:hypothetical protein